MDDATTPTYAQRLARCLADARRCAEACEAYLVQLPEGSAELREAVDLLAPPAAVARTLSELVGLQREFVVATARLLHELARAAADALCGPPELVDALRAAADSSARVY